MMKKTILVSLAAIIGTPLMAQTRVPYCIAATLDEDSDAIGYDFKKKRILMDSNNGIDVVDLKLQDVAQLESLKFDNILSAKFDDNDRKILAVTQTETTDGLNAHALKILDYEREAVRTVNLSQFISPQVELSSARVFANDGSDDVYILTFTAPEGTLQQFGSFIIVDKRKGTARKLIDDQMLREIAVPDTSAITMDIMNQVIYVAAAAGELGMKFSSFDLRNQFVRTAHVDGIALEGAMMFDDSSSTIVASVKRDISSDALYLVKLDTRRFRIEDQVIIARHEQAAKTFWIEDAAKSNQYVIHERFSELLPDGEEKEFFAMKIVDFRSNKVSIPECR
jgi:hypothetical protein